MQTRIREVRLSFVRFERWGDIWSAANPIALELLRSADGYTKEFDQAIQDTVIGPLNDQPIPPSRLEPTALTPPWPITKPKYSHWFWVYYLGKNPENVDGQLALAKLAPFHTGFTATIKPHSKWIGAIADGFIYPYGVGLILTLVAYLDRDTKGGLQSGLAMSKLLEASSEELYDITWNGAPPIAKKVPELADALLDRLRAQVLGPGAKAGERTKVPFVVSAVIRGDTDSDTRPPEFDEVHRMLQGMSSLKRTWENDTLTVFKDALLRVRRSAAKGDLLYHTSRGRAVWFPSSFTKTASRIRTSGCYHRNLTLLHLQAEALLQVLGTRRDLISKKANVPAFLEHMAKDAAQQLSDLYGSPDATYQSSSVRAYLDETSSQKKLVDDALKDFGLDKLQYNPHGL